MKNFTKKLSRLISFLLIAVMLINNGNVLTVLATNDNPIQSAASADQADTDDSTTINTQATVNTSENNVIHDDISNGEKSNDDITNDDEVDSNTNDHNTEEVNSTVSGNTLDPEIPSCIEGKTHEYKEVLSEDNTVIGYCCVFCEREINAEEFEEESAQLHVHEWKRAEDEMIPLCLACGEEYHNCDAEDGIGMHVFELIQEEGGADFFRCIFCDYEKDSVEDWEITLEQYQALMGVSLLTIPSGEISKLPTTIAELEKYKYDTFEIGNYADLAAMQLLSDDGFDFKGYTIGFSLRLNNYTTWDLTILDANEFSGLGTEEEPFAGTLTCTYTGNTLRFDTKVPFLKYVETGATISNMQINAVDSEFDYTGTNPMGVLAAHVVKSADVDSDTVHLSNIAMTGKVTNRSGSAGALFGEVNNTSSNPIKLLYDDSIKVGTTIDALNAGLIAGKTLGNVEVYRLDNITNPTVAGVQNAGMLIGTMDVSTDTGLSGKLVIDSSKEYIVPASVSATGPNCNAGGLVGSMLKGEFLRPNSDNAITVNGIVSGKRITGGIVGYNDGTKINADNITMNATVTGTNYVGGIIGYYYDNTVKSITDDYNLLSNITINQRIYASSTAAGGVIGYIASSNFRIDGVVVNTTTNSNATVEAYTSTGGVIGHLDGQYIEINDAIVKGVVRGSRSGSIGGIIGLIDGNDSKRSIVKVSNAEVSSPLHYSTNNRGGIFGCINKNSMLALDGNIDVSKITIENSSANSYLNRGYIGGYQTEALVYFEELCNYTRGTTYKDNIGNYGGVYRNGTWGESSLLISYENGDVTGAVTQSGGEWILDTEADAIRLAIMLNSEAKFAKNCFLGASKADLLKAKYKLNPADGSMDLEESGIYAFNRNDYGRNNTSQRFHGQFIGDASGGKVSINLGTIETEQSYLSLFPYVGEGAAFENLIIDRTIKNSRNGAGIACYSENNITVKNVDINVALTGNGYYYYYYGGFFARHTANKNTTFIIKDCKLNGEIKVTNTSNYVGGILATYDTSYGTGDLPIIDIDGYELGCQINADPANTSGMITQINAGTYNAILKIQDIIINDNAKLTVTVNSSNATAGGFLGKEWIGIEPYTDGSESYSIKNLTIGSGTAASKPSFISNGNFGGLVNTVTGRIQLKNVKINSGTFTANGSSYKNYNGLLFYKGYNALIEIDDYYINPANVEIVGTSTNNFDEIVGYNMTDEINKNNYYSTGGIVNIIDTDFNTTMKLYENQLVDGSGKALYKSDRTRYYYNLFGLSFNDPTFMPNESDKLDKDSMIISTPDQMMIWHLTQYMSATTRKYLAPFYKNASIPNRGSITNLEISGNIDLKGKSYYPTPSDTNAIEINASNLAKIKFLGELINTGNARIIQPSDKAGEHYMMHSGLLLGASDISNTTDYPVTVQGGDDYLTLSGVITNLGSSSGALFTHVIKGIKNIYHIKLEDLYIHDYDDLVHGCGLLIGQIIDGSTLDISWIATVGYSDSSKGKAASALIGTVGSEHAYNLSIDFTNIKLNDANTSNGVFKYATLIDYHDYTDDTEKNEGRVRYLFTEEAYKGTDGSVNQKEPFKDSIIHGKNDYSTIGSYVTIGNELKDGVEYWNVGFGPDISPGTMPDGTVWDEDGAYWSSYLPYVCQVHIEEGEGKDIEVNPKNAEILEGCGTYEDPYQIEDAKQLLTLARYLTNEGDKKYLAGWKIIDYQAGRLGGDYCSGTHLPADIMEYGKAGFPTRDELRQAYYLITDNIDLSGFNSVTDKKIAEEFVGLGVAGYPFTGVIVGKDLGSGNYPTITLPNKKKNNSCTNFGLIQYAKGAVVKDIQVQNSQSALADIDEKYTNIARVEANGGAVIACILGGDNIIDNVTVNNAIAAKTDNAKIGGYVGSVQQGGLVLRNLKSQQLENFKSGTLASGGRSLTAFTDAPSHEKYLYVSGMIGRVENGYVIYDDEAVSFGDVIVPNASTNIAIYKNNVLPISKTYDILTASDFSSEKDKIEITLSGGDFATKIANAKQLQIVSMAINSDAFSIYHAIPVDRTNDTGIGYSGYNKLASCRKAKYDKVGNCTSTEADFLAATKKDDEVYWYPYIYNYFDFAGTIAANSDKMAASGFYTTLTDEGTLEYRSNLNAVTKDVNSVMTYNLVTGSTYDLSIYERGFRGLGATYRVFSSDNESVDLKVRNGVFSDFRANFNGNGATVKAEMIMDYEDSIHTVALFNDLIGLDWTDNRTYEIKDLTVTGTFRNDINTTITANQAGNRAGALVGMMYRPWKVTNVTAKDVVVVSDGYAAGIVAWINPKKPGTETADELYEFTSCKVLTETEGKEIRSKAGSSGGIIGIMAPSLYDDYTSVYTMDYLALTLTDCYVKGTNNGATIDYADIKVDAIRSSSTDDECHYGTGRSGAIIGYAGKRKNERGTSWSPNNQQKSRVNIKIDISQTLKDGNNPNIQYVKIDGGDSSGGIIGEYYSGGLYGGLVASNAYLNIKNISVSDCLIQNHNRRNYSIPRMGTGGIIGSVGRGITCSVNSSDVKATSVSSSFTDRTNDIPVGGIIGFCYFNTNVTLDNVVVEGKIEGGNLVNSIRNQNSHVGGIIGFADCNTVINIPRAEVKNMIIESDNRVASATSNVNTSDGNVGGIIGRANYSVTIDEAGVTNSVILGGRSSVGGIIGVFQEVYYSSSDYGTYGYSTPISTIKNISVKNCNIGVRSSLASYQTYVGGIYGQITTTYYAPTIKMIGTVEVDTCNIYGYNVGGINGNVYNTHFGTDNSANGNIIIKDSAILGIRSGGVVGYLYNNSSYKSVFSNVTIKNNTILSVNPTNSNINNEAGGVFGRIYNTSTTSNTIYTDRVRLSDNKIIVSNNRSTSYANVGGVYGYIDMGSNNTKIYAYDNQLKNNEIGYFKENSSTLLNLFSTSGTYNEIIQFIKDTVPSYDAKLLDSSSGSTPSIYDTGMPTELAEEDIGNYSRQIGNFVGGYNITNGHVYFVKPEVTYDNTYTKVRPVVDVGNSGKSSSDTETNKLLSYPYNYRANIHVIYQEPDTTNTNSAVINWGTDKDMLFSQINAEAILDSYKNAGTTTERLDAYRLNVTDDRDNSISQMFKYVYKNDIGEYLSPIKVSDTQQLPMIVLDTQYGTTDQMMTSVLAALTGVGGTQNSGEADINQIYDIGINNIANITVEAKQVESGIIKNGNPGAIASLGAVKQNNRWEITYKGYDEAYENGDGTFSLITITYGNSSHYTSLSGTSNNCVSKLQIPVFVIERLTIDTHFKIIGGEVYNTEEAKANGIVVDAFLANDSTYTIYNEYIYGNARYKYSNETYPITVDKNIGFYYYDENKELAWDSFFKGTKLTLIDKSDSDKVYFYEAKGDEGRIDYTLFKDSDGNPYVNKKIHKDNGMEIYKDSDVFKTKDKEKQANDEFAEKEFEYYNVAVERFLIVVDTSNVDKEIITKVSDSKYYTISPDLTKNTLKRSTLTDHTTMQATRLPGLDIGLVHSGDYAASISGRINHDDKITIDGTFTVTGLRRYWEKTIKSPESTIDTANYAKYLEMAIYLTDMSGNRINLPNNTNVIIDGERIHPFPYPIIEDENLGAYTNENTVYFYKDGVISYPLDALRDLINDYIEQEDYTYPSYGTTMKHRIELDFSNADLKDYTESHYGVYLELLRIEEPDYPAGGELLDIYSEICTGPNRTDIACALETKDLLQLGINTYDNQTEMPHTIDYDFKMDFNGVLGRGSEADKNIAAKYYTVTYRLLEKTNRNGAPEYIAYTGDQLYFELVNPPASDFQRTLLAGTSSVGNERNSLYVTYKYDLSEIKNGTDGVEGVITRNLSLTVRDAEQMDLSNYKIQASVLVSDAPPNDIDAEVNNTLSDFFVFTVAKLKTDLDY